MFIWVYRLIFLPVVVLAAPYFFLKMRRRGGYREAFWTRFGIGLELPAKRPGVRRIWIQAVSLGEMLAIEPIVQRLAADPKNEIILTTTTSTGYAAARDKYQGQLLKLLYFPLDFWLIARRFWARVQPDLFISAETELWPEHLRQARRRGAPTVLINARISDRSFPKARKVARYFRGELASVARVMAGSQRDADRFAAIGVDRSKIAVTGNVKIDVSINPVLDPAERAALRANLGFGKDLVVLGSSTWPADEAMLIEAFAGLRQAAPGCRLLIVPRHAERREEIARNLKAKAPELAVHFKSKGEPSGPVDILVADTTGELRRLSQAADVAFVGKSLLPEREGQTPVEAGALGLPMVHGPGMSNFAAIAQQLLEYGAAVKAKDASGAARLLAELCADAAARARMGEAGMLWHRDNRGAVDRTMDEIAKVLGGA